MSRRGRWALIALAGVIFIASGSNVDLSVAYRWVSGCLGSFIFVWALLSLTGKEK